MCAYLRDWVCDKEEKQWLRNFLEGREQGLIPSLPAHFLWFIKAAAFL